MWPPEWPPCPPEWPPPCPPPCPPPRANTDVEPKTTTMLMIRATVWIFHIRRLVGFARMYLMAYFLIRRLYMLSANNWSSVTGNDWPKDSSCVQKIGFTSPPQKITAARVDLIFSNLCATKIPAREKQFPTIKATQGRIPMAKLLNAVMASALVLLIRWVGAAAAWDRGHVHTFAVLPDYAPGVPESAEGLAVGLDGNIYVPSGGFNADGFVPGPATLWVFNPAGHLIRTVTLTGTVPPVLGIAFNPANGLAFIADLGNSSVFKWDPVTNTTTFVAALGAGAGPNAICFDAAGNVYISDSFQGIIWKTDKDGNGLSDGSRLIRCSCPARTSTRLSAPTGSSSTGRVRRCS